MVKLVILLRRKPGMSMEQFIDYYENEHIPFVRKVLPSIGPRYVRNYLDSPPLGGNEESGPRPYFDVITELGFDDEAAYQRFVDDLANPDLYAMLEADQDKFLDRSVIQMYPVREIA